MELTLTKENFDQEIMNSEQPVLVDFWAQWCGPCIAMGPVLADAAEKYVGKIKVAKVNIDQNSELAEKYGVMSIPNFKVFKGGKIVDEMVGASSGEQFSKFIEKNI